MFFCNGDFFFFLKKIYVFIRKKECAHEWGGEETERGGEADSPLRRSPT